MVDNAQPGNQADSQPSFGIEKIYLKDLSVEVPNAPQIFLAREQPQINVSLNTEANLVDQNQGIFEVRLSINVEAKLSENRVLFVVELVHAGIFRIQNVPENELELVLGIGCPNILFPYARETISDATIRAGFQPVLLSPVNFEVQFYQSRQQAQTANGQNVPIQ
jgi:preprotein translocase subunit SecB